ncbi:MAG TPA: glycosyl hydrolase [Phnomibacter sp.]|nr:glycosyl hydrolase [Phnomibacter sp.]
MKTKKRYEWFLFFSLLGIYTISFGQQKPVLIDKLATPETKALYANLHKLSKKHILFGHQHATQYGHGWMGDENRSDVQSVTGSHPAVIGVDFSGLSGMPDSLVKMNAALLKKNIEDTYNRGGVTTASWHFNNPAGGDFYWKDSSSVAAVPLLLPGASLHTKYIFILKNIAALANACVGKDGKKVPIIFRPYHELDGNWFWWGKKHCSAADIKALWQFTVRYLRDSLHVHNFIYAFSPDCTFNNVEEFTERYPGDEWVDMVGMDDYADFGRYGQYNLEAAYAKLKLISDFAVQHRKLAALTETGLESIPNSNWWTATLLNTLKMPKLRLCYVLVWRNDAHSPTHYYAPFPGQFSAPDFIRFYEDKFTLFENDLRKMYKP